MSKKLVVSSAMDQCLVLLASTFVQNFTDFDQDDFPHFRALLKQKGKPGKKIVNSSYLMFMEDFNHHVFPGPGKIF